MTAENICRKTLAFLLALSLMWSPSVSGLAANDHLAPPSATQSEEEIRRTKALESFLHAMDIAQTGELPMYRRILALDRVGTNLSLLLNKKNLMAWPEDHAMSEWTVVQMSKKGTRVIGTLSKMPRGEQGNVLRYNFKAAVSPKTMNAKEMGKMLRDYASDMQRYAVLHALAFMGPQAEPALPAILLWLRDLRYARVKTKVKEDGKEKEIEETVYFPSPMASRAMSALISIGEPAVQPLIDDIKKSKRGVLYLQTMVMAETLVKLKPQSPEAANILIWHMQESEAEPYHQFWFARRIVELDPSRLETLPVLIEGLGASGGTPERASESLLAIGKPAIPALKEALKDPSRRFFAAITLAHVNPSDTDSIEPLLKGFDNDSMIVAMVIEALSAIGAPAVPGLLRHLDNPDHAVAAAIALGKIGHAAAQALPKLILMLDSDEESHRSAAADAIVRIAPDAALMELGENAPESHTHEITLAFSRSGAPVIPVLLNALKHPSAHVRSHTAEALTRILPPSQDDAKRLPTFDFHGESLDFATLQMLLQTIASARKQTLQAARFAKNHREEARRQVQVKADNSPVTPNDKQIQRDIFADLMPKFPDHYFSGEEDLSGDAFLRPWLAANEKNLAQGSGVWIFVDPIDGTSVYARALPRDAWYGDYAVSLLILYNGWPLYALVAMPELDGGFQWVESHGLNATVLANGQPVTTQPPAAEESPPNTVAPGWVAQGREHPLAEMLRQKGRKVQNRIGSIAVTGARLALGKHDLVAIHFGGVDDALIPASIGDAMGLAALRPGGQPVFPVHVSDLAGEDKSFPVLVGTLREIEELAKIYPSETPAPTARAEPPADEDKAKERRMADAMRLLKMAIEKLEEGKHGTWNEHVLRIMRSGTMAVRVLRENRNLLLNILDNGVLEVLRVHSSDAHPPYVESTGTLSPKAVKALNWKDAFQPYLADTEERTRWSLNDLIEDLHSEYLVLRIMALQAIEIMGPHAARAAPHLIGLLPVNEASVQVLIENALIKMGPKAVPALMQARHSPDPYLRAFALDQLGKIALLNTHWPDAQSVYDEITAALQDDNPIVGDSGPTVGDAAYKILSGEIGRQAVPALQKVIRDTNRPAYVKQLAAALWARVDMQAAEPRRYLATAIVHNTLHRGLRKTAAFALPGSGVSDASDEMEALRLAEAADKLAPVLIADLKDYIISDHKISGHKGGKHYNYLPAVGDYDRALTLLGAPAVPYLIDALSDGTKRTSAARILGHIGEAAKPAVKRLLECLEINDGFEPQNFRKEVIEALSKIDPGAMDSLVENLMGLLDDKTAEKRRKAAAMLGAIRAPAAKALGKLQKLQETETDSSVQLIIAEALDAISPIPYPRTSGSLKRLAAENLEVALGQPVAAAQIKALQDRILEAEKQAALQEKSLSAVRDMAQSVLQDLIAEAQRQNIKIPAHRLAVLSSNSSHGVGKHGLVLHGPLPSLHSYYFTDPKTGEIVFAVPAEHMEDLALFVRNYKYDEGTEWPIEQALRLVLREVLGHEFDEAVYGLSHTQAVLRESSGNALSYRMRYDLEKTMTPKELQEIVRRTPATIETIRQKPELTPEERVKAERMAVNVAAHAWVTWGNRMEASPLEKTTDDALLRASADMLWLKNLLPERLGALGRLTEELHANSMYRDLSVLPLADGRLLLLKIGTKRIQRVFEFRPAWPGEIQDMPMYRRFSVPAGVEQDFGVRDLLKALDTGIRDPLPLLAALILAEDMAWRWGQDLAPVLIRLLNHPETGIVAGAQQALSACKIAAIPPLEAALQSPSPEPLPRLKLAAALLSLQPGHPVALQTIQDTLCADVSEDIQSVGLEWLQLHITKESLSLLHTIFPHLTGNTRLKAAELITRFDPQATFVIPALTDALLSAQEAGIRDLAILAVKQLDADLLVKTLRKKGQIKAVQTALARGADSLIVSAIAPMLRSDSAAVRAFAKTVLLKKGAAAVEPLLRKTQNADVAWRTRMENIITQMGKPAAEPLGAALMDPELRDEAIMLLAGLKANALPAIPHMLDAALADSKFKMDISMALEQMGPAAFGALLEQLADKDRGRMAGKLLLQLPDEKIVTKLMAALESADNVLRENAEDLLHDRIQEEEPAGIFPLSLKSDTADRQHAQHLTNTFIKPLLHALHKSPNEKARLAALRLLTAFRQQASVHDALLAQLASDDAQIRHTAALCFGDAAPLQELLEILGDEAMTPEQKAEAMSILSRMPPLHGEHAHYFVPLFGDPVFGPSAENIVMGMNIAAAPALMQGLGSDNAAIWQKSAILLVRLGASQSGDLFRLLGEALSNPDKSEHAAYALMQAEHLGIPILYRALKDPAKRKAALHALTRSEKAADKILYAKSVIGEDVALELLMQIGWDAEQDLLLALEHKDLDMRVFALRVLDEMLPGNPLASLGPRRTSHISDAVAEMRDQDLNEFLRKKARVFLTTHGLDKATPAPGSGNMRHLAHGRPRKARKSPPSPAEGPGAIIPFPRHRLTTLQPVEQSL